LKNEVENVGFALHLSWFCSAIHIEINFPELFICISHINGNFLVRFSTDIATVE